MTDHALRVEVGGPAVVGGWLLVTPMTRGGEAREVVLAKGARSATLTKLEPGPALVCAGGAELATVCRKVVLEQGAAPAVEGPQAGARVTGRVLMGRSPVAGARIALVPYPLATSRFFRLPLERRGGKLIEQVNSDTAGRFTLPQVAAGTYRLDVSVPGGRLAEREPFLVPALEKLRPASEARQAAGGDRRARLEAGGQSTVRPAPLLDLGDISLADGLRVTVTAEDDEGRPVPDARFGGMQGSPPHVTFFEAQGDRRGRAALVQVDPSLPLQVTCLAPGFERLSQPFDSPPAAVRCVLQRLGGLEGKVAGPEGRSVAGAVVTLGSDTRRLTTGKDGGFSFDQLPSGRYLLHIAAVGLRAVERQVQLTPQRRERLGTIALEPAGTLAGQVVDGPTGAPVAGALVTVIDPAGEGGTTSDEGGMFSLSAGSETAMTLRIEAEGYPAKTLAVPPERQATADPLTIELFPGGKVHATVWDEDDGTPCAGCEISLQCPPEHHPPLITDGAGQALSELLEPGIYSAVLVHRESAGPVVYVSSGDNQRRVEVTAGATTEVRFGEPLAVVRVYFKPAPPETAQLTAVTASATRTTSLDGDGAFPVRRAEGEPVRLGLLAVAGGFTIDQGELPADSSRQVVELPLHRGAVTGAVTRGTEPAGETFVEVVTLDGRPVATGRTHLDGTFAVPFLAEGSYRLLVESRPVQQFVISAEEESDLGRIALPVL